MCCCNDSCTALGICLGNITYVVERLASCCAATAVVCCIMATLLIMLGLGVGLGYNYCFVENKLNATLTASKVSKKPQLESTTVETTVTTAETIEITKYKIYDKFKKRPKNSARTNQKRISKQIHPASQDREAPNSFGNIEIKPTMVVPLKSLNNGGLISLLKNLQENNKNFTLELIAAGT